MNPANALESFALFVIYGLAVIGFITVSVILITGVVVLWEKVALIMKQVEEERRKRMVAEEVGKTG